MAVVTTGLAYQVCRATENGFGYYAATSIGVCCFAASCYMHHINELWAAAYLHMMLHLFGNIGNVILDGIAS